MGDDDLLIGDYERIKLLPKVGAAASGDDTINGGPGNDTVVGYAQKADFGVRFTPSPAVYRAGDDVIQGGDGGGLLLGDFQNVTATWPTFSASPPLRPIDLSILCGDDTITAGGGDGKVQIVVGGDARDVILGGDVDGGISFVFGNDLIDGSAAVGGAGGRPAFYGDALYVQTGATNGSDFFIDIVCGNDTITGGATADVLVGDIGSVLDYPDSLDYVSTYYYGNDELNGGDDDGADDILTGDVAGYCWLDAEPMTEVFGEDIFIFTANFGDDAVTDFQSGLDTLVFQKLGAQSLDDLDISQRGEILFIDATAVGGGTVTLFGVTSIEESDVVFI